MMEFRWPRNASRSITGAALPAEMAKNARRQSRAAAINWRRCDWSGVIVRMIGFSLNLIRAGAKLAGWKLYVYVGANASEEYGLLSLMELCPAASRGLRAGVNLEK